MIESVIWGNSLPFNPEPVCASIEQEKSVEWYIDYHMILVDPDVTWEAFAWLKERLGGYKVGSPWAARVPPGEDRMCFYIKDGGLASLFKLTWG